MEEREDFYGSIDYRCDFSRWAGRSVWAFVGFLGLSCLILVMVEKVYLLRALGDFNGADERGRRLIGVHALLMLAAVLAILGLSWMLIFRIGRYFFPGESEKIQKTKYTDAWGEAGKRMKTPEE